MHFVCVPIVEQSQLLTLGLLQVLRDKTQFADLTNYVQMR